MFLFLFFLVWVRAFLAGSPGEWLGTIRSLAISPLHFAKSIAMHSVGILGIFTVKWKLGASLKLQG